MLARRGKGASLYPVPDVEAIARDSGAAVSVVFRAYRPCDRDSLGWLMRENEVCELPVFGENCDLGSVLIDDVTRANAVGRSPNNRESTAASPEG